MKLFVRNTQEHFLSPASVDAKMSTARQHTSRLSQSADASSEDILSQSEEEELKPEIGKFLCLEARILAHTDYKREMMSNKRIGFYRYLGDIGSGNFSKVKLAVHTLLHEKVAVKILDKTKFNLKTRRLLSREINTMDRLPTHANVIQLFEVHETPSKLHLIMEYAPGGEVYHRITSGGRMDERSAKVIFRQINDAVHHLHWNLIIHRDIKAENVFFTGPMWVKIGDFGFSTKVNSTSQILDTFCGSPPYAAPELYSNDSYEGPPIDMWAMGVLLYFMTTAILPFRGENIAKLKQAVLSNKYMLPAYFSGPLTRLLQSLLEPDIRQRATSLQVTQSDWFEDLTQESTGLGGGDKQVIILEHEQISQLLLKWFQIPQEEISSALEQGPTNSLTGVYRLLKVCGQKYYGSTRRLSNCEGPRDLATQIPAGVVKSLTQLDLSTTIRASRSRAAVSKTNSAKSGPLKRPQQQVTSSATCNLL